MKNKGYRIRCIIPDPEDGYLYWSDLQGWVDLESSSIFFHTCYCLPMQGEWIEAEL